MRKSSIFTFPRCPEREFSNTSCEAYIFEGLSDQGV